MSTSRLLTWIELSRAALDANIKSLAKLARGRVMAPSVKANAYGHGLPEIVSLLGSRKDVGYLSVHSLDEAIICRANGWQGKLMILGPVHPTMAAEIVAFDLEPVVSSLDILTALGKAGDKAGRPVRSHLKLETGTNRQGITAKDLPKFAKAYKQYKALGKPYGASTHFANIEDTTSHEYAQSQLDTFTTLVAQMSKLGIKPKVLHTASSAALILFEKTRFDLVRPGISFYGHWPSKETYLSYRLEGGTNGILHPVLTWKTRITQLKDLPADSFIGYGCTYRTTARSKIAVLPIGYYDGYVRALSNTAYVLVRGQRAPVRGRICMNLMMIDVTDIKGVRHFDEVTLIGRDHRETLSAEQLAAWAGTINYEILARLNPALPRVIVG